jgi:hypothetical protein
VPAFVRPLDVDLHESARQLLRFPRSGGLAGAQANDDVVYPNGLTRLQSEVADDPVALVEKPEHGDAVGHRRHAGLSSRAAVRTRQLRPVRLLVRLIVAPATREKNQRHRGAHTEDRAAHFYSGVQG